MATNSQRRKRKQKRKRNRQTDYSTNTARERERRQNDPAYRARYNKLRLDYYYRKQMIILTETQLLEIRDQVFGPCTVIGECFSAQELREDIADFVAGQRMIANAGCGVLTRAKLREWFKLRLDVELVTLERDSEGWHPEGPTEAQAAKEKVERLLFRRRLSASIKAFMKGI
jgi:hypothetical protein